MASSINASTSGAGGLITTADNTGILNIQTAGTTAVTVDASQNSTFSGNIIGKQSGLVQPYLYYKLNSAYAGSNSSTAQSLLGVGVTLAGSTQYEFEIVSYLAKTAGTTSHTFGYIFGGTATFNHFAVLPVSSNDSSTLSFIGVNTTPATVFVNTGAITSATYYVGICMRGTMSVNAGGTFIPQYKLSAAPGGAYTTQIGSYMKICPIGAAGANVNFGSWA